MNIILGTSSLMLNDEHKKEHVRYLQTLKIVTSTTPTALGIYQWECQAITI